MCAPSWENLLIDNMTHLYDPANSDHFCPLFSGNPYSECWIKTVPVSSHIRIYAMTPEFVEQVVKMSALATAIRDDGGFSIFGLGNLQPFLHELKRELPRLVIQSNISKNV